MPRRPCLDCGRPSTGTRCRFHAAIRERAHHNPQYSDPRYVALRRDVLSAWRDEHGNVCPGDDHHASHPAMDLTLDHLVPLVHGGSLLDTSNMRVLCRSANSARGAR